jgi:uncharacterized membrane protein
METKKKHTLLILGILLLAFFIRVYNLSEESVWKDEALNVMTASKETIPDLIRNLIVVQSHPPLFTLILHYWGNLFGFSEFSIRFVSVLFGIGIVLMVYLVSKEMFDKRTAILAMILSAISTTNLVYAQEAKQYSMFAFFVLFSTYFLIKAIKDGDKKNIFILLYFISSILMFYTHAIGIIFFFIQSMFFMLFEQKLFFSRKVFFLEIVSLVLVSPILFITFKTLLKDQKRIISALYLRGAPFLIAELGYFNLLWPVLILGLAFVILYIKFRRTSNLCNFYSHLEDQININSKKNKFILFFSISPILVYLLYGIFINLNFPFPNFITKYPYFMLAFVHIFVSRNLLILSSRKIFCFLTTAIVIISLFMIFNFYVIETKSDWKTATEVIRNNIGNNDILVYSSNDNIMPFLYYFPNKPFNYSNINYPIYDYLSMEEFDEYKMRSYPTPKNKVLFLMKDKMEERNGGVWVVQYYSPEFRPFFDEFAIKNLVLKYKKNFDEKNKLIISYYGLS